MGDLNKEKPTENINQAEENVNDEQYTVEMAKIMSETYLRAHDKSQKTIRICVLGYVVLFFIIFNTILLLTLFGGK